MGLICLLAGLGYLYRVSFLYQLVSFVRLGEIAATSLSLLVLGGLCARPDRGPMRLLFGQASAGWLARRMLLVTLVVLPLLGWLRLEVQTLHYLDTAGGTALLVLVSMTVFALMVWGSAASLQRIDDARADALRRERESELVRLRLYEAGVIGIARLDEDGVVREANDRFLALVGYSRDELTRGELHGRTLAVPEVAERDAAAARLLATTGSCGPYESALLRRDGTRVPVLVGAAT